MQGKKGCKLNFRILRIIFYVLFFGLFILLPVNMVEGGSLCAWNNLFGILCPGCGTTRAFVNFMHGNFHRAFEYNPVLTAFFAPGAITVVLQDFYIIFFRSKKLSAVEFIKMLLMGDI